MTTNQVILILGVWSVGFWVSGWVKNKRRKRTMTQENKQLLLKDLCARLPYGVIVKENDGVNENDNKLLDIDMFDGCINYDYTIDDIKPYLRPMSSMTDKEETLFRCELPAIAKTDAQLVAMRMELFLKGHLDFNHLIEKGLALKAPDNMYKTE